MRRDNPQPEYYSYVHPVNCPVCESKLKWEKKYQKNY